MPRIFCSTALASDRRLELPPAAARHVQVLRLQPGDALTLFDGHGGEYAATVQRMGRSEVMADIGPHRAIEREAARELHLAVGLMASDRMDWLVEKATELGAASIQPLAAERSVLRLAGERATKKEAHWRQVAIAACEQCGRNRVPTVHPVQALGAWLAALGAAAEGAAGPRAPEPAPSAAPARLVLSFAPASQSLDRAAQGHAALLVLSGPEGGLAPQEEALALRKSFLPASLGSRVLRAETAPLAALARLA